MFQERFSDGRVLSNWHRPQNIADLENFKCSILRNQAALGKITGPEPSGNNSTPRQPPKMVGRVWEASARPHFLVYLGFFLRAREGGPLEGYRVHNALFLEGYRVHSALSRTDTAFKGAVFLSPRFNNTPFDDGYRVHEGQAH